MLSMIEPDTECDYGIRYYEFGEEAKAIESFRNNYVVYYIGTMLVDIYYPMSTTCSIFGRIHIDLNNISESILRHEYGHIIHERELGTLNYIRYVAIPSVRGYYENPDYYYSQPWEMIAEILGGNYQINGPDYYLPGAYDKAMQYYWKLFEITGLNR